MKNQHFTSGDETRAWTKVARACTAAAAALTLPGWALAHGSAAGHDHGLLASWALGFSHPFSGLDHLAAMVALGLWSALALKRAWLAPASFVLALLLGAALTRGGLALPLIEPMIAVSLLVLGLLVVARTGLPLFAALGLSVCFALFHGAAHGQELAGPHGLAALMGMAVATALLHGAGIALGRALQQRQVWMPRVAGAAVATFGALLLMPALARAFV